MLLMYDVYAGNNDVEEHATEPPRKKRGRPRKQPVDPVATDGAEKFVPEANQNESSSGTDDELIIEEGSGQANMVEDKGFEDAEEYNSEELDSGSDSDGECEFQGKFPTFKQPKKMLDYKWEVGTYFGTKSEFQHAMRTYAIHSGREIKFVKNDKLRMRLECRGRGNCEWKAFCAKIRNEATWQLRQVGPNHTCSRGNKVKFLNSKWLGTKLQPNVRENPTVKIQDIINKSNEKWNIKVTKTKAIRARSLAFDAVDGSFREQYTRMHDYCHELLRSNPHSTVKITSTPYLPSEDDLQDPTANLNPHFQRVYICFKACKDSFLKCRPIIGLDGCFLKGYYGGQLLTAIGTDPNDQILPIAYAVVEGETKETWAWFLDLLVNDLGGVAKCAEYTFISDQQKVCYINFL